MHSNKKEGKFKGSGERPIEIIWDSLKDQKYNKVKCGNVVPCFPNMENLIIEF